MCPESYSWEVREAAEELYIIDGRTYEQVAEATGVSVSQLKRWGMDSEPSWSDRRKEYRQAQTSVRRNVMLAKAKLIESVIESEDPMKAFAFNSLVKSGQAIEDEARARAAVPNVAAATPDAAGDVESEVSLASIDKAVFVKINEMLNQPGALSLSAIRELKKVIAELLKAKADEGADKSDRQIDSAKMQEFREQFGL